jgi:hypothetical protein
MIDYSDIEQVVEACYEEMKAASRDRYDAKEADKTASLCLTAQLKLSMLIEDTELLAKHSKNEVARIEAEKYFEYKTSGGEKKTEAMINAYVAKSPEVVSAKRECAEKEAAIKKWNYVLGVLNNSHVFFRNLGKNKTWAE